MAFYSSSNKNYYLAIAKQTAKGTAGTAFNKIRALGGITFEHNMDEEEIRETGWGKNPSRSIKKIHKISGTIPLLARPDIVQQLATYALGTAAATAATSAVPAYHEITPADTLPYLTLGIRDTKIEQAMDAVIREFKISAQAANEVRLDVGWIGCNVHRYTAETAGMTAATYVDPGSATFKFAGGSYYIDGPSGTPLSSTDIKSYSLTYANKLDEDEVTINNYLDDLPYLERSLAVEFVARFNDQTLFEQVYYGSSAGTAIPDSFYQGGYFSADHTFNSGSAARELKIIVPKVQLTAANVNRIDPDSKTVEITVVGKAIEADPLLTIVVKNGKDTAY